MNETRVCRLGIRESVSNLGKTGTIPRVRDVDLMTRFKDFTSRDSSDRTDLALDLAYRFYDGFARFDFGIWVDGITLPSMICVSSLRLHT